MYLVDLLTFVVFAGLTALAQNVWELILFRFLLGVGIGADYPISSTLLSEFSPKNRRGRQITTLGAMWFVGAVAAYGVGIALTPLGLIAWRYMLLVGAALAVVVILFRASIPESPRWLLAQGRADDATNVLHALTKTNIDPGVKMEPEHRGLDVFTPKLLRRIVFVCGFWFCYTVAYYGISMYTPTILTPFTHGNQTAANIGSAIISAVGVLGAFVGNFLVDTWGRRPLLITSFAGLTGVLAVLALSTTPTIMWLVILFALAVCFANMGPGILNFVYPTELFSTSIRAGVTGFATAVSRGGSILGVVVFPNLVATWGVNKALWLFVAAGLIGLLLSIWLAPETKGRSLEDINTSEHAKAAPVTGMSVPN
ncbi:MFS transporter [Alicyclobacillus herbarius]|uniref:MFS transporter n=1 Tax=Alicyclobacillus herbarius TaxID=122960 RepID=UPI0004296295|nr:MFS transporter [Alicyclobacillus herbarius]